MKRRITIVILITWAVFLITETTTEAMPLERPTMLQLLLDRCPKLSNPIECRDRSGGRGDDESSRRPHYESHNHTHSNSTGRSHFESDDQHIPMDVEREDSPVLCFIYRVAYILRHGASKPDPLKRYRDCRLWKEDWEFHRFIAKSFP